MYSPFLRHEGLEQHYRHLCTWDVVLDHLARVARDSQSAALPVHERAHPGDDRIEVVRLLVTATAFALLSSFATDSRKRGQKRPEELVHGRLKEPREGAVMDNQPLARVR